MKRKKVFIIIVLMILFVPFIAYADTWLDKEEYRDISWFNESSYSTTNEYTIDTKEKLAGLLYLVNEKDYTFANKTINIIGQEPCYYCSHPNAHCAINMTAHEWIPLKSSFSGIFNGGRINNSDTGNFIQLKNINNKNNFTESGTCESNNTLRNNFPCNIVLYEGWYSFQSNISGNGSISFESNDNNIDTENNIEIVSGYITINVHPDAGYYLDDLEIVGKSNNDILVSRVDTNKYLYESPPEEIIVNVTFKKKSETKCVVISGNGKKIGDEVACGSEHFYVISNKNGKIKMMAKYNLNTGVAIYKDKLPEGKTCSEYAQSKGGIEKSDEFYNAPGYCFYTKMLPNLRIIQDEEAKSAHWDADLNYLYPQVGDIYLNYNYAVLHENPIDNSKFYDFDLGVDFNNFSGSMNDLVKPLYQYKERLNNITELEIENIEMLSISELNDILDNLSNKRIPLIEWGEEVEVFQSVGNYTTEIHFGDLKPFIPEKYKWLYSTTYWNSTVFESTAPYTYLNRYFVFTAEQGKLCGAGFQACAPTTTLGCG